MGQPPQKKPYGKDICKPATNAQKKAKPSAIYKLSKLDITFPCIDNMSCHISLHGFIADQKLLRAQVDAWNKKLRLSGSLNSPQILPMALGNSNPTTGL
jgi:hypothetical protein